MSDLEKYLTGEFTRDRRDITDIEKLLCDASAIYEINCHPKFAWVYRLPSDGKDQSRLSQSTTTMILGALQCYLGHFNDEAARKLGNESKANFLNIGQISNRVALDVNINLAAIALLKETLKKSPGNNSVETKSGTFGKDDIFTLAWLAEVSQANWNRFGKDLSDDWVSVGKAVQVAIEKKLNDWRASADFSPKVLFDPSTGDLEAAKPLAHSFPVLRLVQAIRRLAGAPFGAMQVEYRYRRVSR